MSDFEIPDHLRDLPSGWRVVPFTDVFSTARGNGYLKQSDYQETGTLPVVDQGQDEIGGYTTDESLVCDVPLPCIVFGDHTRIFKFIDYPFVIGAQGTKVLIPCEHLDPRYAYHYLLQLKLPDEGYSRHFKYLKRETMVAPPLEEQRRIAAVLDRVDTLRDKRRRAQSMLDDLVTSAFNALGGKPVKSKLPRDADVPAGWRWVNLGEVARLESGHTPSRKRDDYWGGDVRWLSLKDVSGLDRIRIYETEDRPTELGIANSSARLLPADTVALCRTASVGNVVILGLEMATSQDFVNWVCGPEIIPEFLYAVFLCSQREFEKEMQGSTHKTIYMPTVKEFKVLLPPLEDQRRIANLVRWRDEHLARLRTAGQKADELYHALAQLAFRGELFGNSDPEHFAEAAVMQPTLFD